MGTIKKHLNKKLSKRKIKDFKKAKVDLSAEQPIEEGNKVENFKYPYVKPECTCME
jgi:hypothetical protein